MDAKTIALQNNFVRGCSTSGDQLILLWRTMRRQTILQERSKLQQGKERHRRRTKQKKKSDEIETLIDELEKRTCLFPFRRIFDRQFLHDVVEIAPFIPSSDPLPHLTPSGFFILISETSKATKTANDERTWLKKYE